MKHVLLITGGPGTGKTTAIRKVAAGLAGRRRLAGFVTEEIRTAGARLGFRLVTFDGREAVLAHVGSRGSGRVGRYGVDVAAVDAVAASALALRDDRDVYIVDEIGNMECLSPVFVEAMRALLGSPKPVVATVARRGGGLIGEVKRRADAELLVLTPRNRDALPGRVLAWLGERSS